MTSSDPAPTENTLADYLAIFRRHIWTIGIIAIVVPASAYFVSTQQKKVYSASAKVLLNRQDIGSAITGVPSATANTDPDRVAQTQAEIARSAEVAADAIKMAGIAGLTPAELVSNSSVTPESTADILRFTVKQGNTIAAIKLANAYANAYSAKKFSMDTASMAQAAAELDKRLAEMRRTGLTNTQVYGTLLEQAQNLHTLQILQNRPEVVARATKASLIQPTPKRNALIGAILGLLLAVGIAFLWNALDKRVRTEDEMEEILGIPLLARLPNPARRLRGADKLSMIDQPTDVSSEAVRRLRTNLEIANLDGNAKALMVTSAAPFEGKSTTIANLAVALARSGRSVALIDLDLRRPTIAPFFGLEGRPGVTEVALGRAPLGEALAPIALPTPISAPREGRAHAAPPSLLDVLPCGQVPANPGEFVGTHAVAELIKELRRSHDFVLVDVPPLLSVGDAMTISTLMDAVLVVVKTGVANRPMLKDLARGLAACPASKIGFVVTGVDERKIYGAASYYAEAPAPEAPAPLRRLDSSGR
jgi:capsular exopolysaccharide synthesis family protein